MSMDGIIKVGAHQQREAAKNPVTTVHLVDLSSPRTLPLFLYFYMYDFRVLLNPRPACLMFQARQHALCGYTKGAPFFCRRLLLPPCPWMDGKYTARDIPCLSLPPTGCHADRMRKLSAIGLGVFIFGSLVCRAASPLGCPFCSAKESNHNYSSVFLPFSSSSSSSSALFIFRVCACAPAKNC